MFTGKNCTVPHCGGEVFSSCGWFDEASQTHKEVFFCEYHCGMDDGVRAAARLYLKNELEPFIEKWNHPDDLQKAFSEHPFKIQGCFCGSSVDLPK